VESGSWSKSILVYVCVAGMYVRWCLFWRLFRVLLLKYEDERQSTRVGFTGMVGWMYEFEYLMEEWWC